MEAGRSPGPMKTTSCTSVALGTGDDGGGDAEDDDCGDDDDKDDYD